MNEEKERAEKKAERRAAIEAIKKARPPSAIPVSRPRQNANMPRIGRCPTPFCDTLTIRGTMCSLCSSPIVNDVVEERVFAQSPLPEVHRQLEPRPTSPAAWLTICIMLVLTMVAAYMEKQEDRRAKAAYSAD